MLGWGVQQRRVRMWAAADRNDEVAAAAAADDDDDDDDDANDETDAARANCDSDCSMTHKRSASDGDATASECSNADASVGEGGRMEGQGSARAGDDACASRMAVAVQMQPSVT